MKNFKLFSALSLLLYAGSVVADSLHDHYRICYLGSYNLEQWINASQNVKDSGVPEEILNQYLELRRDPSRDPQVWSQPYPFSAKPSLERLKEAKASVEKHVHSLTSGKQESVDKTRSYEKEADEACSNINGIQKKWIQLTESFRSPIQRALDVGASQDGSASDVTSYQKCAAFVSRIKDEKIRREGLDRGLKVCERIESVLDEQIEPHKPRHKACAPNNEQGIDMVSSAGFFAFKTVGLLGDGIRVLGNRLFPQKDN